MCYMAAQARRDSGREARVGVRELRQNLSVYLDRVKLGESLIVTEHGQVVALLQPVTPSATPLDALIDRGLARSATRSLHDVVRQPLAPAGERPLSEILEEMRRDERS